MARDESFPNLNTKNADGLKPGGKPYRVFVVEGKDFQRKQLIQILESEQYKIVGSAVNGKEALNALENIAPPPDLITTDLDMPVLDGYALMFELKNRKTGHPWYLSVRIRQRG